MKNKRDSQWVYLELECMQLINKLFMLKKELLINKVYLANPLFPLVHFGYKK
jgi:hypothetical protein